MEWLSDLLRRPSIAWWDLLDIALVSVLVYELLLLIRGTRAVQMALGASFLIGLFFASRWFELETVNWVIRNLASYVVFASIPRKTSLCALTVSPVRRMNDRSYLIWSMSGLRLSGYR